MVTETAGKSLSEHAHRGAQQLLRRHPTAACSTISLQARTTEGRRYKAAGGCELTNQLAVEMSLSQRIGLNSRLVLAASLHVGSPLLRISDCLNKIPKMV